MVLLVLLVLLLLLFDVIVQKSCQKAFYDHMSELMSALISDNTSKVMPEPVSERMADTMLNNHWWPL